MKSRDNPVRTTAYIWWIVAAVFLIVLFAPFVFAIGGGLGVLIFMVGFLMTFTGIGVALFYMDRAGKVDEFLDGETFLVHWTYSTEEWQKIMEPEYASEKMADILRLVIIAVIVGILAVIFWAIWPWIWVVGIALLFTFLFGGSYMLNHWYLRRKYAKYPGEVYISRDAVYVNRRLHVWTAGQLAEFVSAEYKEEKPPLIIFTYNTFGSSRNSIASIPHEWKVRVPIPQRQETKARELVEQFQT